MLCVECFGGLAPCPLEDHPEHRYHYKKYVNELNLDGIEFPMKVSQIAKFERQNTAIWGFLEN